MLRWFFFLAFAVLTILSIRAAVSTDDALRWVAAVCFLALTVRNRPLDLDD